MKAKWQKPLQNYKKSKGGGLTRAEMREQLKKAVKNTKINKFENNLRKDSKSC